MSTALVSPLSDVSDILLQNQNLVHPRGHLNLSEMLGLLSPRQVPGEVAPFPTGGPAGPLGCSRTRNASGSSSSSAGSLGKYAPQTTTGALPPQLLSFQGSDVPHRKLDRSISEPVAVDRNNNSAASSIGSTPPSPTSPKNVNSSRYKTELCRPFEENGFCKYGDKCQFAHGENELRSLNRHPKYKTELCRTFHSVGFCPYGPRCHFIHNEDERKLSQINHMKSQLAAQQAQQQQQQHLQVVQQLLAQAHAQQHQIQPGQTQVPRSAPQPMHRAGQPKQLNFSLPPMVRDTLGSTADSPPSSLRGSPTLSPIDDALMSSGSSSHGQTLSGISMFNSPLPQSATPPPQSAPPGFSGAPFTFPQPAEQPPTPPSMSPLNVHTTEAIASLAAGMQATSLNTQHTSDVLRDVFSFMPPSPPQSGDESDDVLPPTPTTSSSTMCSSPLELSRGLRLPIFSQLSTSPDSKIL